MGKKRNQNTINKIFILLNKYWKRRKRICKGKHFSFANNGESRNFRRKKYFLHLQHLFTYRINSFSCDEQGWLKHFVLSLESRNCDPQEIFKYNIFLYSIFFLSFQTSDEWKENFSYSLAEIWCWKSLDKRNLTSFFFLGKVESLKIYFLALIYPWWVSYWFVDGNLKFEYEWNLEKKNDF